MAGQFHLSVLCLIGRSSAVEGVSAVMGGIVTFVPGPGGIALEA